MTCSYEFDSKLDILEIAFSGLVSSACVLKSIDAVDTNPHDPGGRNEIRDCSAIEELQLDARRLDNLAQLLRGTYLRAGHRKRVAFLATSGPGLEFSKVMRDALDSLTAIRAEIFSDRDAALAFLSDNDRGGEPLRARQTG
ncbi:hypothetical protein LA6_000958 [Marinibacterium anthonyi]|nr:hypothetical protein LA6_000958 [Marinibacterium anthonyi]